MSQSKEEKNSLNMAGEYGVCSELHKRGITANITFGKEKAVDIVVLKDKIVWTIEVKTSMRNEIVTQFLKNFELDTNTSPHPDFWVLVHINDETFATNFYVLTHKEIAEEHKKKYGNVGKHNGVFKLPISQLEKYKNKWDTIINYFK